MSGPTGIDYDPVTDEIVVASQGNQQILVFHRTDTGDVAPLQQIDGIAAGLTEVDDVAFAR